MPEFTSRPPTLASACVCDRRRPYESSLRTRGLSQQPSDRRARAASSLVRGPLAWYVWGAPIVLRRGPRASNPMRQSPEKSDELDLDLPALDGEDDTSHDEPAHEGLDVA